MENNKLIKWFQGDDPNVKHEQHMRTVEEKDVHVPHQPHRESRRDEARRKWRRAFKGIPHAQAYKR